MDYRWIGAVLIVMGCGGFGFFLAVEHRHSERCLENLIRILDYMACELQFRMTPLPELCIGAGREVKGELGRIFSSLGLKLQESIHSDVSATVEEVLKSSPPLPPLTRENILNLGSSLGRFDIAGQLKGLEACRDSCRKSLDTLKQGRDARLRNYQTLSLCAGAALAILLI